MQATEITKREKVGGLIAIAADEERFDLHAESYFCRSCSPTTSLRIVKTNMTPTCKKFQPVPGQLKKVNIDNITLAVA